MTPTDVMNLWLANESEQYHRWLSEARAALALARRSAVTEEDAFKRARRIVTGRMHNVFLDTADGQLRSKTGHWWADLLVAAVNDVAWTDVAERFVELAQETK